jgi:hypothetical protein
LRFINAAGRETIVEWILL